MHKYEISFLILPSYESYTDDFKLFRCIWRNHAFNDSNIFGAMSE